MPEIVRHPNPSPSQRSTELYIRGEATPRIRIQALIDIPAFRQKFPGAHVVRRAKEEHPDVVLDLGYSAPDMQAAYETVRGLTGLFGILDQADAGRIDTRNVPLNTLLSYLGGASVHAC
jgi:hypothetical protein